MLLALASVALLLAACDSSGDGEQDFPDFEVSTPVPEGADCEPSISHVTFPVRLPRVYPHDVQLTQACTHEEPDVPLPDKIEQAEFIYENPDKTASVAVVTARVSVADRGRQQIDLAGVPAFVDTQERNDGTRTHSIEFSLDGRAYTVIADLGPNNLMDEADLLAVAESVATSPPITP